MDFIPVCKKIEEKIKARIEELGLVKSGKLYNSISVNYSNGSFFVTAEDYYTVLDEKYKISESIFASDEVVSFMEVYISTEIEKEI